jgi:hypothetical protein
MIYLSPFVLAIHFQGVFQDNGPNSRLFQCPYLKKMKIQDFQGPVRTLDILQITWVLRDLDEIAGQIYGIEEWRRRSGIFSNICCPSNTHF